MYNIDIVYNHIVELEECINNFPNSPLRPIWEKALETLKDYYI